jgi:hypothetical protein
MSDQEREPVAPPPPQVPTVVLAEPREQCGFKVFAGHCPKCRTFFAMDRDGGMMYCPGHCGALLKFVDKTKAPQNTTTVFTPAPVSLEAMQTALDALSEANTGASG